MRACHGIVFKHVTDYCFDMQKGMFIPEEVPALKQFTVALKGLVDTASDLLPSEASGNETAEFYVKWLDQVDKFEARLVENLWAWDRHDAQGDRTLFMCVRAPPQGVLALRGRCNACAGHAALYQYVGYSKTQCACCSCTTAHCRWLQGHTGQCVTTLCSVSGYEGTLRNTLNLTPKVTCRALMVWTVSNAQSICEPDINTLVQQLIECQVAAPGSTVAAMKRNKTLDAAAAFAANAKGEKFRGNANANDGGGSGGGGAGGASNGAGNGLKKRKYNSGGSGNNSAAGGNAGGGGTGGSGAAASN